MTRKRQLHFLIFLTGLTAIAQYVIQGVLATTHNPLAFPNWFWIAEFSLWGGRALIEAWIIVFLFSTEAKNWQQRTIIVLFEVVLLAMIAMTVGFSLRAIGYAAKEGWQEAAIYAMMLESLGEPGFTLWTIGVGAYTAAMMAAAGTAYRVQPSDAQEEMISASELHTVQDELHSAQLIIEEMQSGAQQASDEIVQVTEQIAQASNQIASLEQGAEQYAITVQSALHTVQWLGALNPTSVARLIAIACENGSRPAPAQLAELLSVSPSTVVRGYQTKDKLLKELAE